MRMRFRAWHVYLGKRHTETVYFEAHLGADEVKQSLVDHDGYSKRIVVKWRDLHGRPRTPVV